MTNKTDATQSEIMTAVPNPLSNQKSHSVFGLTDLAFACDDADLGFELYHRQNDAGRNFALCLCGATLCVGSDSVVCDCAFPSGRVSHSSAAWGRVAVLGFIGTTLYQPMFINGLALTKASNSALILASTPVFIVLFNRALGRGAGLHDQRLVWHRLVPGRHCAGHPFGW